MLLFPVALVLLLAWGVLAVGGSPTWAGAPVAVFSVATGILGLIEGRQSHRPSAAHPHHRSVFLALCLLVTAVGAQLIPLAQPVVARLSPQRDLVNFERLLATADRRDPDLVPPKLPNASRPLSIAPARTWYGLGFLCAFAIFLLGASRALATIGVVPVTRVVIALGVVVAFLGMYQATVTTEGLYAIYTPLSPVHRSAPFINRNHQSGWLVMVLALALGSFAGEVAHGMRNVKRAWRDRILWFSRREANVAALLLFASAVLAMGVLASRSRSGAAIMVLTFMTLAGISGRRQPSRVRRGAVMVSVIAVALISIGIGASPVLSRFAEASWSTMDGRVAVWMDSFRILSDFWLTGSGFNTYGVAMLHYQTVTDGYRYIEAHNDYLQLAAEGGLLIGIPVLILLATIAVEIRRRFRQDADDTRTYWLRVGAVSGIIAVAVQSTVEFTLQMPGAAAMFATLLAISIHHPRPRHPSQQSNR